MTATLAIVYLAPVTCLRLCYVLPLSPAVYLLETRQPCDDSRWTAWFVNLDVVDSPGVSGQHEH